MTIVSNDPAMWPLINLFYVNSYFSAVTSCMVIYDCILTFGQELDLIWRQQWSFMTVLYLIARYIGIPYSIMVLVSNILSLSLTDAGCNIIYLVQCWTSLCANTTLEVILIARLYAMYHGSKKMLVFLIAVFIPVTAISIVILALQSRQSKMVETILSGTFQCIQTGQTSGHLLSASWAVGIVWEVITLSLAIWSAVKHFRQRLGGWTMNDFFAMLIRTHVFYFASFLVITCLIIAANSQPPAFLYTVNGLICADITSVVSNVQMFVLGPRLILGVRGHRAKGLNSSNEATAVAPSAYNQLTHKRGDSV